MPQLTPATPGSLKLDDLERTLGVYFIGYVFAMVLYGFTFFQSYMYYSRYPKDHWATKTTVVLLCCLDTVATAILSQTLYYYLVELFPYTTTVEFATTPFCSQLVLSVVAVFLAQMFYASTVWSVTKNAIVAGATAMFATAGLVLGIVMSIQLFQDRNFSHLAHHLNKVIAGVTYGMVAAAGLVALIFLSTSRLPAPYKPINGLFDAFISYVVSRGGAAFLVQFALIFVFIGTPSRIYWFPFYAVAEKLFVISAITLLNSREGGEANLSADGRWGSSGGVTRTIGSTMAGNGAPSGLEFNHKHQPIVVEVAQSTHHDQDKINYDSDIDGPHPYASGKGYAH